jgi:hypothetical protein
MLGSNEEKGEKVLEVSKMPPSEIRLTADIYD